MEYAIEAQKNYLKENLEIEPLRKFDSTKDELYKFKQAAKGSNISSYLRNNAWSDDCERNTKVFLVRDKTSKQIVFYFSLNCGILYEDFLDDKLKDEEKIVFKKYVEALSRLKECDEKEQNQVNEQLNKAMGDIWEVVEEPDRVSKLMSLAKDKVEILEEKNKEAEDTHDKEHTQAVKETFPAIDIKFLCRNKDYVPQSRLDFKLGVYVFWEIIVPHILEISELVGCKYVYLFAADRTNEDTNINVPMWTPDYDPDEEYEGKSENDVRKLVAYYINELKFENISKYTILKPSFERTCFTLVQEVSKLEENREMIWQSHMLDIEANYQSDLTIAATTDHPSSDQSTSDKD